MAVTWSYGPTIPLQLLEKCGSEMDWGGISIEVDPPAGGVKEVASQRPPKNCGPRGWGIPSLAKTLRNSPLSGNRAVHRFPRNLGGLPRTVVVIAETNNEVMHDLAASLGCGEKPLDF